MMQGDFRFVPDKGGIEAVSTGPGVAPILNRTAAAAAERMENFAGSLSDEAFFEFKDSIRALPARPVDGEYTAYAGSDSPGWHLQEFGTAHRRPFGIIRKAMRAVAGLKFKGN